MSPLRLPALLEAEPLAPRTTLGLGGAARFLVEADRDEVVVDALRQARRDGIPVAILGGGSNLVVADGGFDGLVIRVATRGIAAHREGDSVRLVVAAGEPFDPLVERSVADGLAGIECLSGIPGLAGATPIQNVGAYGQEVAETIVAVRGIDAATLETCVLAADDCGFGYRTSRFRRSPGAVVVTAVELELRRSPVGTARYPELAGMLGSREAPLARIREGVLELRRGKGMVVDPVDPDSRSAGSFFTNPVVAAPRADDVARRAVALGVVASPADLPGWPADGGMRKLSAAWLIEKAGFRKGETRGGVGISGRHPLALVHRGGGSSRELVALAREIRDRVVSLFGVRLEPEPVFLGFGRENPLD